MKTTIDTPEGTRMLLAVGDDGAILGAFNRDGSEASHVSEQDAVESLGHDRPAPEFQVIGGSEGPCAMPRLRVSGTAAKGATTATYCYWVKLHNNGWVRICW